MNAPATYRSFLEAKAIVAPPLGFDIPLEDINPALKPHTRAIVQWAVAGGRRAMFMAFGLHKTVTQIEVMRLIGKRIDKPTLIVLPLGVRQEFIRDAALYFQGEYAVKVKFIRRAREIEPGTIHLTNYETIRDGKLDPALFGAVSLDEASVLRGFGGSKTFREFMRLFEGRVAYKFVATATPSPNEFIELLAYAAFLEVMDVGQVKTRFFKRNSEKADTLTIHPHKEREFWLWCATWGMFVQKPSNLGFSDEGYDLPELDLRWHEIPSDHGSAGVEKDGQGRMFRNAAIGVVDASREKRDSLPARIAKLMEIRAEDPQAHRLLWHDLEDERRAIEAAIPSAVSVYGSQDLDERERAIIAFSDGKIAELAGKASIMGSGCNFQRHCSWAVFLGIGFKFNDFIQAIHRVQRFGQTRRVRVDLIFTEAEREVRRSLERKWAQHKELVAQMTAIIREYGLNRDAFAAEMTRALGVKERIEVAGPGYRLANNDCVDETSRMPGDSVALIVTSIPFSNQYEYTPNYADFGHTDDNGHFWRQMDYLTPQLLRILQPGRVAAIHVKDRITPGGVNGLGFQTLEPFSDECVAHFRRHGFAFLGRKIITTDVVRENNQTYRLGWSEQCKDGSRMGPGVPEYLLLFRKPPSDLSNGYADKPVIKPKKEWQGEGLARHWVNPEGYSRARWQLDAHAFNRSSGNRQMAPEEFVPLAADMVYKTWRGENLSAIYDFEHHVRIAETLEIKGQLPSGFMLMPPHSWHDDVWTDVARMLTMNTLQAGKGKEGHLCPLQFDIVDRAIAQFSEPGEMVFDPFGGLMTVPYRAIKLGRQGSASELNPLYFLDGCKYVEAAAREMAMPDLFSVLDAEARGSAGQEAA
ncbi:DNA methylase N-4 [Labrys sp. KNU-23]|uniref:DNA methyltransferase n=1 Tax=Labrys sp. KNU-23 TaxID=2789216 RepID=UPI0011EC37A0|nr:DNA methyltransferase [Labrys sp. KNU-23]QEN86897.1 DNA methylase N-4 [Labrys sp. KNU-23]